VIQVPSSSVSLQLGRETAGNDMHAIGESDFYPADDVDFSI
jgi:hypothetical protein